MIINTFNKRRVLVSFISLGVLAFIFALAALSPVFLSSCTSPATQPTKPSKSVNTSVSENSNASETNPQTAALALPDYSGYINDYTGTLSSEWKLKADELVKKVETDTSCEIAVAVIKNLDGITIEEYALKLFEKWGIGKKDKDNGVLLLVAMSDRKLRIEVGYGLEAVITDLEAREIIDNVITPRFKLNDYNTGIYDGISAIANIIYK
jgi:Beta-propeller domains of methanol dehydrogenase type